MSESTLSRRGLLAFAPLLICAPAIVRATSLMPVRPIPFDGLTVAKILEAQKILEQSHCFEPPNILYVSPEFHKILMTGLTMPERKWHEINAPIVKTKRLPLY